MKPRRHRPAAPASNGDIEIVYAGDDKVVDAQFEEVDEQKRLPGIGRLKHADGG